MPRLPLLMMATLIGAPSTAHVASSWLVIWKQPSPSMAHTSASGLANLAPIAAGMAKPMVPRPPEFSHVLGFSYLMNCAVEGAPIKVAVINNGNLGMVRQWQTPFYGQRYSNTDLGTHKHRIPDFVKLAEALGCVGLRCETAGQLDATLEAAMNVDDQPVVIDF